MSLEGSEQKDSRHLLGMSVAGHMIGFSFWISPVWIISWLLNPEGGYGVWVFGLYKMGMIPGCDQGNLMLVRRKM